MLALLNPTHIVQTSGLAAVFILSVLQSCCVPTSSELTLGFAGVLASEGKLSLPGVIGVGVAGELIGAYVAWVIGRSAGRVVVDRWGKYVLLSHRDLDRAEAWYARHPRWGVFGSRLLPVIRNFVALPAGIAEVPAVRFGILTLLGSAIWDAAMALIGYGVGGRWRSVMKGFSDAGYLLGALVVVAVVVFIWHRYRSYKAATSGQAATGGRHLTGAARVPAEAPAGPTAGAPTAGRTFLPRVGTTPGVAGSPDPVAGSPDPVAGSPAISPTSPPDPSRRSSSVRILNVPPPPPRPAADDPAGGSPPGPGEA